MREALIAAMLLAGGCSTPTPATREAQEAPPSLIGAWRQTQEECGQSAINELLFKADGTFHVTWVPFETYEDYWGAFRFEAASGQLDLAIANGNNIPADVVPHGHVTLTGDTLIFDGASLGSTHGEPPCAGAFHRR